MDGIDVSEREPKALAPGMGAIERIARPPRNGLFSDLVEGLRRRHSWTTKAWYDIVLRYRRTALGPLWLVLTTGTMIGCLTLIGPALFGAGDPRFIPYMVSGIVCWTYVSLSVTEMSGCFADNASDIRSIKVPFSLYLFQTLFRNVIVFAHLLVVYVVTLLLTRRGIEPNVPLFLLDLVLVVVWLIPAGFVLATACARFRDVQQLVGSVIQVAFLLTPVFWDKALLLGRARSWVVEYNPLFHVLDVLRSPLLGEVPAAGSYVFLTVSFLAMLAIAALIYRGYARRISFWV